MPAIAVSLSVVPTMFGYSFMKSVQCSVEFEHHFCSCSCQAKSQKTLIDLAVRTTFQLHTGLKPSA
jgi:hypothetical protein